MRKKKQVSCPISVQCIDCMLVFELRPKTKGQQLLDMVCKDLNIYEKQWFGLSYIDTNGNNRWSKLKNDIKLEKVKTFADTNAHFKFAIRFYPQCIRLEILQDSVKSYFFKCELLRIVTDVDVDIPAEYRVLTAVAYACLTSKEHPPDSPEDKINKKFDRIFPAHVMERMNLSKQEWLDAILAGIEVAKTQHYTEPLMQALECMEQCPMYGTSFFDIINKKGTALKLGIDCHGLTVYKGNNRIQPSVAFIWEEIHAISYQDSRFMIKLVKKDNVSTVLVFDAKTEKYTEEMMNLIIGNHTMYRSRKTKEALDNPEIKEANLIQQSLNKEKKLFEQQKEIQHVYESHVKEMITSGHVDEDKTKKMEDNFNKTKEAMQKQIEEAQRLAEEERIGKIEAEQEVIELRAKAQELEQKLVEDEKNKHEIALLEADRVNQEEIRQAEIDDLNKKMKELELIHQQNLRILQEEKQKETERKSLDESVEKTEEIEIKKEEIPLNYQEIKKLKNDQIKAGINEKFGTIRRSKKITDDPKLIEMEQFTREGRGKTETLRIMIKNNTRTRIDQFESL
uniref:Ezrin (Trinotate prediction) n=1 Tax=Henneguya salminicola TaxID=69463 RepID=A0A6G3ME57_HENSL